MGPGVVAGPPSWHTVKVKDRLASFSRSVAWRMKSSAWEGIIERKRMRERKSFDKTRAKDSPRIQGIIMDEITA